MTWRDERDQTQARVLADSISPAGVRVTTIEVTLHRFVLAELNTHRVFSRNSASSRAIPVEKQVRKVDAAPAYPVVWASSKKGMQGGEPLLPDKANNAALAWDNARYEATEAVRRLHALDVHKSLINRLIEPFMWHTVIVTATEWDGFWEQRCSPLAQPEIRVAAEAMRSAYDASAPAYLMDGGWHTPLIQPDEDYGFWLDLWMRVRTDADVPLGHDGAVALRKRVSAARCARVSYLTHDGTRDVDKDLALYERLVDPGDGPGHWSPFEHVATPCQCPTLVGGVTSRRGSGGLTPPYNDDQPYKHLGNLSGWDQMRHEVEHAS